MNNFSTYPIIKYGNSKYYSIFFALIMMMLIFSASANAQVQIGATNYTSLYNACNAINSGTHTGAITMTITGNTSESSIAQLNSGSIAPANYTSVTIKPSGSYTISASHGGTILYLNGASNVTIDGSQTSGGTTQNLIFQNNAASSTIPNSNTILNSTIYGGCILAMNGSNITVKNTQLISAGQTAGWGVNFYAITTGTIDNCTIKKSSLGVLAQLSSSINITNSTIGSMTSSDNIGFRGICYYGVNTFVIKQNEIVGLNFTQTTAAASARAITIHTNSGGGFGTSTNGLIDKNKIHNLRNTVSGAYGIVLQGALATDDFSTTISNNLVYDILVGGNFTSAIVLTGAGINTKIYHNTINLYIPTGLTNYQSYAVYILQTNIDFRNNIIMNQMASTNGDYGIIVANAAGVSTFTNIDYNTYVLSGSGTKYLSLWSTVNTADATGLASWQTTTAGEANSTISTTPAWVADDNPHLNGSSLTEANLLCVPIPASGNWDAKDYDGETRRTGTNAVTFRGADEVFANLGITQSLAASPAQSAYCVGSNVTLSFAAGITSYNDGVIRTNAPSPTYTWYKTSSFTSVLTGQTNSSLTLNSMQLSDGATYFAYAKILGDSIVTNTKTITIESAISIVTHPQSRALCSSIPNLTLNVVASGSVGSYQWQKETPTGSGNYQNITGQKSAIMSIVITDAQQATGNYRVIVNSTGNCGIASLTSNPANVTVADPLTSAVATINTPTPDLVCTGSDLQLTAQVGKGTILGYQWQRFDGIYWADVDIQKFPTAKQAVLVMTNVKSSESSIYQCLIYGSDYCSPPTMTTNPITVKVWDLFQILEHPINAEVCNGERVLLSCSGNGKIVSFQWQKDGIDISLSDNSTARNSYFVINSSKYEQSGLYRCKMTIQDCRGTVPVYTDAAVVYVTTPTSITKQPAEQMVSQGSTATLSFVAHVNDKKIENAIANGTVNVQWYKTVSETQTIALNDNMPRISGSKSNLLTINNFQIDDIGKYFAEITGLCGVAKTIQANLTLDSNDITIIEHPQSQINCEGTDVIFIADATSNISKNISYQWYKDGLPINDKPLFVEGSKSKHLIIYNVGYPAVGKYYAKVSIEGSNNFKLTAEAQLTLNNKPVVITQPKTQAIKVKDALTLSIELSNQTESKIKYTWYKDLREIPNTNKPSYTINSITVDDAGSYYCAIENDCGTVNSDIANISITTVTATDVKTDVQSNGFALGTSSPSPFNSIASVRYYVPEISNVRISITNIEGSFETEIVNQVLNIGEHYFTINPNQLNLVNGTYFLKLESNGVVLVQKIIVLK